MEKNSFLNIDQYISNFPNSTQKLLQQIRKVIAKAAPKATETIKYAMPTFDHFGNLVHFAAYKNHIGFYPAPSGLKAFQEDINKYPNSKGAVQFPLDKPLPTKLITEIVKFRALENENKATLKSTKKRCPNGHAYFKSSTCPTCPVCEAQKKSPDNFMQGLSAPAQRALKNKNINTLQLLSNFTEKEVLAWHGIGKASIPKLKIALAKENLSFK
jgi:uncharacterized protein YdhG (YjbR/CyaY superfamily)